MAPPTMCKLIHEQQCNLPFYLMHDELKLVYCQFIYKRCACKWCFYKQRENLLQTVVQPTSIS